MLGRSRLPGAALIDIERIRPDSTQPRRTLDPAALRELADSIRRTGILQPIAVRYLAHIDVYQIISGERRYQAARAAGLNEMPCWVQSPADDEILLRQIIENWQRSDLKPFELSDSLAKLRDERGLSQDDIARMLGKPKSEVSRLLSMQKIEPEVQSAIRSDDNSTFTRRHLIAVAQLHPEKQSEVVEKVRTEQLTAIETEKLVTRSRPTDTRRARRRTAGARRRFVIGSAVVEVCFRKQSATTGEIVDVLTRAAKLAQEQSGLDE